MGKYVFSFKQSSNLGKSLLGGKGAGLAEMTRIGLPVPMGFTITTETCNLFYEKEQKLWSELKKEIMSSLRQLEEMTGKKLGDSVNPLLVSVRSGAIISMPGMMDTILNLGLNEETMTGLAKKTNNKRFAYDSYRRFIQMFSDVVKGVPKYKFEYVLDHIKEEKNYQSDLELTEEDLLDVVSQYKLIYKEEMGEDFPSDPLQQLFMAVEAVFKSWNNNRAIIYRNLHKIPHELGTAVNVQSMVFGNMGKTSGTGVCFTRNPSTGDKELFGEYLVNAQGEDVVAGIRTPQKIDHLKEDLPKVYDELIELTQLLEDHYHDMQDIEFTIENEKLYLLQTRTGKRTASSAIKIAVDLVLEKKISKEEAILRIEPNQIDQILHPSFSEEKLKLLQPLATGLPASPGAASGKVYFHAKDILEAHERGENAILVRQETSPEDIEGMAYAKGILTSRGGMTSHAAVVARGMGKCCVVGCTETKVNETLREFRVGNQIIKEGEEISLDGVKGNVYMGSLEMMEIKLNVHYGTLMKWIDEIKELKVRANADTKKDTQMALNLGAEGIGLCRTEHMFFAEDRILEVRKMILSKTLKEREKALYKLETIQKDDFIDILREMKEKPCTIRLLDPPLHEFLPHNEEDINHLGQEMDLSTEEIKRRIMDLDEFNPMLGHRGCRLAITYPEIYLMQTKAIIKAAIQLKNEKLDVKPEIMIPLISDLNEFHFIREKMEKVIEELLQNVNMEISYQIGTMIEVPRAALLADEIAREAQFFSFGTNDLTQMTYGFSRDDSHKYLKEYTNKKIFNDDPFQVLDQKGVGKLLKMAVELGRKTNPSIKVGICGEHGGEASSVEFCHDIGLDYVSCSPYRVPIAKLAAAQSTIKLKNKGV